MKFRLPRALSFGLVFALVQIEAAPAQDCAGIRNDRERLRCYDEAHSPQQQSETEIKNAAARAAFAGALRRYFLEKGFDIEVLALEKDSKPASLCGTLPAPCLRLIGFFNGPMIHQLIRTGKVLESGRARGFGGVMFIGKGHEGDWLYDISGPTLPKCDVAGRLCL